MQFFIVSERQAPDGAAVDVGASLGLRVFAVRAAGRSRPRRALRP